MKSSQETCCTETVIFGGKICTVRKFYMVYSGAAKAEYVRILLSANHRIALRKWNRESFLFCANSETSRFLRVSASHACMNEHLCAGNLLRKANSEMQRSGIELACL